MREAAVAVGGGSCLSGLLALLFGVIVSGYGLSFELLAMSFIAGVLAAPLQGAAWFLTRKSSTGRRILAAAATAALCVAAVGAWNLWANSPRQLFKSVVMDPLPESVQVLHGKDTSMWFRPMVMLHFKIAPEDFAKVMKQHPFTPTTEHPFIPSSNDPAWWRPQQLSPPVRQYVWKDRRFDIVHGMWVNSEGNEVFYVFVEWQLWGH